jgi:energy-coupling factor transport system permease protein
VSVLAAPVLDRSAAPLARTNPVAKLVAAFAVAATLLPTVDLVTPSLVLAAELVALPFYGLRLGLLLRRGWPLLVAATGVGLSNLLFASGGGRVLVDWGPIDISESSLHAGGSLALRVLAIALPGVLAFMTTDPTDLADALVQQARLPWRFALGTLAALRLLPLLAYDWRMMTLARRARGVEAGRSPVAKVQVFGTLAFALLVGAVRRGVRLATAMDARGFGSATVRTYARRQRMRRTDWAYLGAVVLLLTGATVVSVTLGAWDLALT